MSSLRLTPLALLVSCTTAPGDMTETPPQAHSERVHVSATLREAGVVHEAVVTLSLDEGVSARDSGIPGFIVQLDVPDGVELIGERVLTFEALRDNEFLMEPWERLVEEAELVVPLRLSPDASAGATLGINVVGYLSSATGEDDAFLRRRLELPLEPGATATTGDPRRTTWGPFGGELAAPAPLAIGDPMPPITLPRLGSDAPGSTAPLLGSTSFLLVTYRGHW